MGVRRVYSGAFNELKKSQAYICVLGNFCSNKKTMSSTNVKKGTPKLEDDHFETWKKYLKIWCKLTDITDEKRALAVDLTLSGRARAATSELSVDDLEK